MSIDPRTSETRATIVAEIVTLLDEADKPVPELTDDVVLLETGLDSLDFAVLVTRLEDAFDRDPFTEMAEPVYPETLGEMVAIYADQPVADA